MLYSQMNISTKIRQILNIVFLFHCNTFHFLLYLKYVKTFRVSCPVKEKN